MARPYFANKTFTTTLSAVTAALFAVAAADAAVSHVTVETSACAGQTDQIAFDFSAGFGSSNTFAVLNLSPVAGLVGQSSSGAVTGSLPVGATFATTHFASEILVRMLLGNSFSFDFQTGNQGPAPGSFRDEFSLFLLDSTDSVSLVTTSDATGANALPAVDLPGVGGPVDNVYSPLVTLSSPALAPEASTRLLLAMASGFFVVLVRRSEGNRVSGWIFPLGAYAVFLAMAGMARAQSIQVNSLAPDADIAVSLSGFRLNRAVGLYSGTVTVKNTSGKTLPGPFYVGITNITDDTVVLANRAGNLPDGTPYLQIPGLTSLASGQTWQNGVVLSFANPLSANFSVTAQVYDAASAPPAATLTCPQPPLVVSNPPVVANYAPPVDTVGRTAVCAPAPGENVYDSSTRVNCVSQGGVSLPASCTFNYPLLGPAPAASPLSVATSDTLPDEAERAPIVTQTAPNRVLPAQINLPQAVIIPVGTITIHFGHSDMAVIPCANASGLYAGGLNFSADYVQQASAQACFHFFNSPGVANFTIINYGPETATNATVTFSLPPGFSQAALKFSSGGSCAKPVTTTMLFKNPYTPFTVLIPTGEKVTCKFPVIGVGQTVDSSVGLDVPNGQVPSIYAQVSADQSDSYPSNNSIYAQVAGPAFQSIQVNRPSSSSGCNPSGFGFAILLDTCGVPSYVTQAIVGGVFGVATIAGGGALLSLSAIGVGDNVIFNAGVGVGIASLGR